MVKKSGAWFTYGEDRFQGREGFRLKLVEMDDIRKKLETEVRAKLGMPGNGKEKISDEGKGKEKEKKTTK